VGKLAVVRRVKVEKGWLTLEGEVDWFYQKQAAKRAVRYLRGVRGVSDAITLSVRTTPRDVKSGSRTRCTAARSERSTSRWRSRATGPSSRARCAPIRS
jgi:osmotically-inducible protein OsmY